MYTPYDLNLSPDEVVEYLRKSRSDDPTLTVEEVLEKHETILDEWAEANLGGKVPEENKYREVVSGETIADRPEINAVLKRIESPKIKALLVVEVQRISRGDLEDAGRLLKLLRYTKTLVITPQKVYDLRDEYDRDIFERELKRGNEYLEYQKKIMGRGRLLSVQQGNYIGQTPPYGYDKIIIPEGKRKCHTLTIKESEAEVVRMIFDMYVNQDMGHTRIAHRLDEMGISPPLGKHWSPSSIKDMLANVHYLGKVKWNWRKTVTVVEDGEILSMRPKAKMGEFLVYDGKHEAIISEELFQAAQEKQGRNYRAKPTTKIRNPLAGLVYCQCGRMMSLRTYKKDGEERSAPRLLCDNQSNCHTSSCLYEEMIDRVCEVLQQCIHDFEVRIKNNNGDAMKLHRALIKRLEDKLEELDKREISQWEKYTEDAMPKNIFDRLNEKLIREREEVTQALCTAKESFPDPVDYEEKLYRFKDALESLKNPDSPAEQKNRLLKACIDRIDYTRKKSVRVTKEMIRDKTNDINEKGWYAPPFEIDVKLRF